MRNSRLSGLVMLVSDGVQAEEVGEEAVEAIEQAAQDPSRFANLGQTGQAVTSGVLSMNDTTKLGIEVRDEAARRRPVPHAHKPCLCRGAPR